MPGLIKIQIKKFFLDFIFLFCKIIIFFSRKQNIRYKLNDGDKIVILAFFRLGDNLFLTSVYREIKMQLPNVKITILTNSQISINILKHNPYVKSVWLKNYWQGLMYAIKNNQSFNLLIDYSANFYWSILFLLLKIDFRLSRENYQKIGHFIFRDFNKISNLTVIYQKDQYIVDYYLSFLGYLGLGVIKDNMEVFLDVSEIDSYVKKFNFCSNNQYIVCHLGAMNKENIWHAWAGLINLLVKTYPNHKVVITGMADDKIHINSILVGLNSGYEDNLIILVDKLKLRETVFIISRSVLYIGGDTGLTHAAIAMNTSTVIIFGRANYKLYTPQHGIVQIIYPQTACYPSYDYHKLYQKCSWLEGYCIDSIKPITVLNSVKKILNI